MGKARRRGTGTLVGVLLTLMLVAAVVFSSCIPRAFAGAGVPTDAELEGIESPSSQNSSLMMGQRADLGSDGRSVTVTSS